jgi:HEPN domain-containing protein
MQAGSLAKAGLLGVSFLVLVACEEGSGVGEKNFQKQYSIAREALESGRYATAAETYAALIPRAGPLAPRLKLEYAHTKLRAGHYDAASEQAVALANSETGVARSAALAVHGTAEHEMARASLDNGDRAKAKVHLQAAEKSLSEMLRQNPELDPLGAMAGRHQSIKARLQSL